MRRTRGSRAAERRARQALVEDARLLVGLLANPRWRVTEILREAVEYAAEHPAFRDHLPEMAETGRALRWLGDEIATEFAEPVREKTAGK